MRGPVDLALGILDHQLVDSEERRCGNVDDLELVGVQQGTPRVEAILVGPPVWRGRGRIGRTAAAVARGRVIRVPWDEVKQVDSAVRLKKTARELGLGRGDDRARRLVAWIPGAK
jgi:sporulation protein YlmC with PRC-barrel domain